MLAIRRNQDIELLALPDDESGCLQAVQAGCSRAEACDAAAHDDINLGAVLGRHVALGVIAAIRPGNALTRHHESEEH